MDRRTDAEGSRHQDRDEGVHETVVGHSGRGCRNDRMGTLREVVSDDDSHTRTHEVDGGRSSSRHLLLHAVDLLPGSAHEESGSGTYPWAAQSAPRGC